MADTVSRTSATPLADAAARKGARGSVSVSTLAWLGAVLSAMVVFVGSALIVLNTAGSELERQLQQRDRDAAILLATLASQVEPTRERLAPLLDVLAATGQYALLRIEAPGGEILSQRVGDSDAGVPHWFASLRPLTLAPATARVERDGAAVATVTVVSSRGPTHAALWHTLQNLLAWLAVAALGAGMLVGYLTQRLITPLTELRDQARALAERRFTQTALPAAIELQPLSEAMNALAQRLETDHDQHSAQLGQLDHLAGHDELTGLPNRNRFLALLDTTLEMAALNPRLRGSIAVLRVSNLAGLNRSFGRTATDKLLVDVGARLRGIAAARPGRSVARLNGCDFALIAPDVSKPDMLASELSGALTALESMHGEGLMKRLPIGVVGYAGAEPRERLLSRLDSALAAAEYARRGKAHIGDPETVMPARTDLAGWREALDTALTRGDIRIDRFPVLDQAGELLHFEAPSRILIDDLWYSAEAFLAWAERLEMTARIDLAALRLALECIEAEGAPQGINVSASSLRDAGFLDAFRAALQARPKAAERLWVELPEHGVVADLPAFRALCLMVRPFGCQIGIEHAGREFGQLGGLHDVGLAYVKVDAALVRNVAANQDKFDFLVRICELARAIGLKVIAEGVDHLDDLSALRNLDFDGMTGSVIRLTGVQQHG